MISRRPLHLLAFLLVGPSGCAFIHHVTFEREAMRHALPDNVTLKTVVSPAPRITVEQELLRLGAHVDEQGKLRDSSGKEIRFVREERPSGTCMLPQPLSPEELQKQAEREQFVKDYTVIVITWNQNNEPPPP